METRANHVMIGAFTLVVLAGAMLFALWIGKATLDREWRWYHVVFNEAVSGLTVGGAVQYNGIQVGDVRELALDPDDPSLVIATIRVAGNTPVKTDTAATLAFTGLTGVSIIQLTGGSPDAPLLLPGPEGRVPVIEAQTSAVQSLLASSEDIATTTSQVLVRLNALLSDENAARITGTLQNIDQATGAIAESRAELRTMLEQGAAAATRLNTTLASAEQLVTRLDGAVATLDDEVFGKLPATIDQLQAAVAKLDSFAGSAETLVEENAGAITQFSQQGLAQIGPTLLELRELLRELNDIAEQLEQGPADFLLRGEQVPEFEP